MTLFFWIYNADDAKIEAYLSQDEENRYLPYHKLIEEARDRGELICNDGDGEGYYRSYDIGQIERQYRVDRARAMSVMKRLKTMRRMLNDAGKEV